MSASTWAERQWEALAREGYRFDPESSSMRTERYAYTVPKGARGAAKAASDAADKPRPSICISCGHAEAYGGTAGGCPCTAEDRKRAAQALARIAFPEGVKP